MVIASGERTTPVPGRVTSRPKPGRAGQDKMNTQYTTVTCQVNQQESIRRGLNAHSTVKLEVDVSQFTQTQREVFSGLFKDGRLNEFKKIPEPTVGGLVELIDEIVAQQHSKKEADKKARKEFEEKAPGMALQRLMSMESTLDRIFEALKQGSILTVNLDKKVLLSSPGRIYDYDATELVPKDRYQAYLQKYAAACELHKDLLQKKKLQKEEIENAKNAKIEAEKAIIRKWMETKPLIHEMFQDGVLDEDDLSDKYYDQLRESIFQGSFPVFSKEKMNHDYESWDEAAPPEEVYEQVSKLKAAAKDAAKAAAVEATGGMSVTCYRAYPHPDRWEWVVDLGVSLQNHTRRVTGCYIVDHSGFCHTE